MNQATGPLPAEGTAEFRGHYGPRMGHDAGKTLADRLSRSRERAFVGRATERAVFRSALAGEDRAFSVLYLHGPGGVGKSTLLRRLSDDAREAGRFVVEIDARTVGTAPPAFEAEADPAYVWHELALIWQTPGAGEEAVAAMFGAPVEEQTAGLVAFGMTAEAAESAARASGPEMGACILALYRSAAQPALTEWGIALDRSERPPGLVINATEDVFVGGPEFAHRAAVRFGAQEAVLKGLGHWWMLQDPRWGAAVLNDFHVGLDS